MSCGVFSATGPEYVSNSQFNILKALTALSDVIMLIVEWGRWTINNLKSSWLTYLDRTHSCQLWPDSSSLSSDRLGASEQLKALRSVIDILRLIGHLLTTLASHWSMTFWLSVWWMQITLLGRKLRGHRRWHPASNVDSYPAITADFVSHYHNHIEFWLSSSYKWEVITALTD